MTEKSWEKLKERRRKSKRGMEQKQKQEQKKKKKKKKKNGRRKDVIQREVQAGWMRGSHVSQPKMHTTYAPGERLLSDIRT
jgi:hypothetical protein